MGRKKNSVVIAELRAENAELRRKLRTFEAAPLADRIDAFRVELNDEIDKRAAALKAEHPSIPIDALRQQHVRKMQTCECRVMTQRLAEEKTAAERVIAEHAAAAELEESNAA